MDIQRKKRRGGQERRKEGKNERRQEEERRREKRGEGTRKRRKTHKREREEREKRGRGEEGTGGGEGKGNGPICVRHQRCCSTQHALQYPPISADRTQKPWNRLSWNAVSAEIRRSNALTAEIRRSNAAIFSACRSLYHMPDLGIKRRILSQRGQNDLRHNMALGM